MANEFIARKGLIALEDSQISGSLSVTNSVTASFFTGSYRGDGSQLTGIEGFPFTGSAGITGSLTVVGPVNATTFTGDGSQLTGIEGFPFTGSAKITGSLEVTGSVTATSFTGSIQGTATSASYVQLANIDGFTAYSASVNTAIDSVLDATTPLTATVNTTNSPFTITSQSIVVIDSTNGDVTVNLPDLNAINGTPDQKPILLYKNDYSQNVIYVQPSGSQLVNGTTQDIIVSIQIAIAYNPTSAGWVTEGTSYQSLAELEMFFVPRTETGSFATTGSNQFSGSQAITGSLTVTGGIVGTTSTASYVEYTNVANKPTLISGSSQVTYSGLSGIPSGILSGSAQIADFGIFATTGSNQFNGNQSITGSLTVSGQVVAQTLNVQQVTSSIVYSSGSNVFGNSLSNTQQFTGSVGVTGSLTVNGTSAVVGSGTANYLPKFTAGSTIGNSVIQESSGNIGIGVTPTRVLQLSSSGSSAAIRLDNTVSGRPFLLTYDDSQNLTFINSSDSGYFAFNSGTGASTTKMLLTNAGNLGLGVTPSAWNSAYRAMQFGTTGAIFGESGDAANYFTTNTFVDSVGFKYITSDWALGYFQENGVHSWRTAPSGTAGNAITFTQAMTLDANGNLGIGTTSNLNLGVAGNVALSVGGSTAYGGIQIRNSTGNLEFFVGALTATDTLIRNNMNGDLRFGTNGTERMRITSGGYTKISNLGAYYAVGANFHELRNTIADNEIVNFSHTAASPYGISLYYTAASPNNSSNWFLYCSDSTFQRMSIRSNGGIYNYQANDVNLSDERTKKDIEPLESYWDKFKSIEIVKFKYKDQTHDDFNIGVIAQQVESIAPEFVDVDGWDTKPKIDEEGHEIVSEEEPLKSIYTADLYHATIKVLQECMSKIEEQQAQIEILKAEIQTLKQ